MIELDDGAQTVSVPVIDASVHIFFGSNRDLRQNFLREPFSSRGFPDYEMDWYGAPGGEYAKGTTGPDGQYPARMSPRWPSTSSRIGVSTSPSCTR